MRVLEDALYQKNQKYLSSNNRMAEKILQVLKNLKARNDDPYSEEQRIIATRQKNNGAIEEEDTVSTSDLKQQYNKNGGTIPTSTKMCIFQLQESNDLDRLTMLMDHLAVNKNSPESVIYMLSKFQLDNKLTKIYKMYCNGEYGFDHYASKSG